MSPYEPAINTTQSPIEKVKYWLEVAMETASMNHMAIIGFIVNPEGAAEPFASGGLSLRPEEFRRFIEILAEAMNEKEN